MKCAAKKYHYKNLKIFCSFNRSQSNINIRIPNYHNTNSLWRTFCTQTLQNKGI